MSRADLEAYLHEDMAHLNNPFRQYRREFLFRIYILFFISPNKEG